MRNQYFAWSLAIMSLSVMLGALSMLLRILAG